MEKIEISINDLRDLLKAKESIYSELDSKLYSIGITSSIDFLVTKASRDFDNILINSVLKLKIEGELYIDQATEDFSNIGEKGIYENLPKDQIYTFDQFTNDWK